MDLSGDSFRSLVRLYKLMGLVFDTLLVGGGIACAVAYFLVFS
jgi:hypothetical protein